MNTTGNQTVDMALSHVLYQKTVVKCSKSAALKSLASLNELKFNLDEGVNRMSVDLISSLVQVQASSLLDLINLQTSNVANMINIVLNKNMKMKFEFFYELDEITQKLVEAECILEEYNAKLRESARLVKCESAEDAMNAFLKSVDESINRWLCDMRSCLATLTAVAYARMQTSAVLMCVREGPETSNDTAHSPSSRSLPVLLEEEWRLQLELQKQLKSDSVKQNALKDHKGTFNEFCLVEEEDESEVENENDTVEKTGETEESESTLPRPPPSPLPFQHSFVNPHTSDTDPADFLVDTLLYKLHNTQSYLAEMHKRHSQEKKEWEVKEHQWTEKERQLLQDISERKASFMATDSKRAECEKELIASKETVEELKEKMGGLIVTSRDRTKEAEDLRAQLKYAEQCKSVDRAARVKAYEELRAGILNHVAVAKTSMETNKAFTSSGQTAAGAYSSCIVNLGTTKANCESHFSAKQITLTN